MCLLSLYWSPQHKDTTCLVRHSTLFYFFFHLHPYPFCLVRNTMLASWMIWMGLSHEDWVPIMRTNHMRQHNHSARPRWQDSVPQAHQPTYHINDPESCTLSNQTHGWNQQWISRKTRQLVYCSGFENQILHRSSWWVDDLAEPAEQWDRAKFDQEKED